MFTIFKRIFFSHIFHIKCKCKCRIFTHSQEPLERNSKAPKCCHTVTISFYQTVKVRRLMLLKCVLVYKSLYSTVTAIKRRRLNVTVQTFKFKSSENKLSKGVRKSTNGLGVLSNHDYDDLNQA